MGSLTTSEASWAGFWSGGAAPRSRDVLRSRLLKSWCRSWVPREARPVVPVSTSSPRTGVFGRLASRCPVTCPTDRSGRRWSAVPSHEGCPPTSGRSSVSDRHVSHLSSSRESLRLLRLSKVGLTPRRTPAEGVASICEVHPALLSCQKVVESSSSMWQLFFAIEGSCWSRPALEELDLRRVREKTRRTSRSLPETRLSTELIAQQQ